MELFLVVWKSSDFMSIFCVRFYSQNKIIPELTGHYGPRSRESDHRCVADLLLTLVVVVLPGVGRKHCHRRPTSSFHNDYHPPSG